MLLHRISSRIVRPGTRVPVSTSENYSTVADLRKARGLSRKAVQLPSSASAQQSTFTWSATCNRELETPTSKFIPTRPYLFTVIIPEPPEPIEAGPTIPYLPDYFQSNLSQSASPLQQPPSEIPRVLTVASASTHQGGGPLHGLYGKATDAHLQEVHGDAAAAITSTSVESSGYKEPGIIVDILDELGLSTISFKPFTVNPTASPEVEAEIASVEGTADTTTMGDSTGGATVVTDVVQDVRSAVKTTIKKPRADGVEDGYPSEEPVTGKLGLKDVQGLYALTGIISVGYLLSKIFA